MERPALQRTISPRRSRLVAVLALAALAASVALFGTAVGAQEFSEDVVIVEDNSTTVEIAVDGDEEIAIELGDEDRYNYELEGTLDPAGADTVELSFDRTGPATENATLSAAGDASVEITEESSLERPLDPAEYELRLLDEDGVVDGVLFVVVEEDEPDPEPAPVVDPVIEDGWIVLETGVEQSFDLEVDAESGTVVDVRMRSPGVFTHTNTLTVEDGTIRPTLDFAVNDDGLTGSLEARADGDSLASYELLFSDDPSSASIPSGEAADSAAQPDDEANDTDGLDLDGDEVLLESAPDQPLETTVDLPDGATVELSLEAPGSFLLSETATVEDGTASTRVDLESVPHGTHATLTARADGDAVADPQPVVIVDDVDAVSSEDDDAAGGAGDDSLPGFGPWTALAALLLTGTAARLRWSA